MNSEMYKKRNKDQTRRCYPHRAVLALLVVGLLIGGTLTITSTPGAGTSIRAVLHNRESPPKV